MSDFITVNGATIDIKEAIRLSFLHDDDQFVQNTIDFMLINQGAGKADIANTDEELQLAVDELRYQRGLESAEKAQQWITENNLDLLVIQNGINNMLVRNKLRSSIPDSEIEAYFAEHQREFDRVELYSIRVDSEELAQELYAQITEEDANFHLLALEHSQDEVTRPKAGYVGKMTRSDMTGEIEAAVFKAQPGEVVGPMKTEQGYNLFLVKDIRKASLEKEKDRIQITLFTQILNKLHAEAKITYPIFEK
jgi:parvulin-like peptidyl-prolyl isomerase